MVDSSFIGFEAIILSPEDLSGKMLRYHKYNLNQISHDTAVSLIQLSLTKKIKLTDVYVDTVGPPDKYQSFLKSKIPKVSITVSKKADSLFAIVSAASIVAKVVRDHVLENWKYKERITASRNFGSGYPNDPATKNWLKVNTNHVFGFPSVIRFSWQTCTNYLEQEGTVDVDWKEFNGEEDGFGAKKPSSKKQKKKTTLFLPVNTRSRYFSTRQLTLVHNDF
eukprot:TRINITY_DN1789_c0_g1_i1.p1 TRINITY_DN1789_c0_g1~~TRINITY_DN1789_c0_g1_i1.p1  ORF type:complete len:222 (+),score=44.75 TRINITY_DN1789_c0_g1_i1:327-992(+)